MKIKWKQITNKEIAIINSWLSLEDKQNLCMTQKSWQQTATDIEECLAIMQNAQFKNIMGYINGLPAVACMFGVEQINVLNLYNIVVNPKFRNMGIAKNVILQLLSKSKNLNLTEKYNKVVISTLPTNSQMHNLLKSLNFIDLGFNGEYVEFEKDIYKNNERTI